MRFNYMYFDWRAQPIEYKQFAALRERDRRERKEKEKE